jgi:hypothetical protein
MHMQLMQSLSPTPPKQEYIIYTLNENEEYVVSVNPWVTYSSVEISYNELLRRQTWSSYVHARYRNDIVCRKYYIGEHMAVLRHDKIHGYIARVA